MSGAISGMISFNFTSRMSLCSCGLHGRVICPMTGKSRLGVTVQSSAFNSLVNRLKLGALN
jgi:hypothetical protein